jgi:hypothetical protein
LPRYFDKPIKPPEWSPVAIVVNEPGAAVKAVFGGMSKK